MVIPPSKSPELLPPERVTLQSQVASRLRAQIASGAWDRGVPSERWLGDHLQVSRPTVRAALASLRREGLIRTSARRRTQVVHRRRRTRRPAPPEVNLLTVEKLDSLSGFELFVMGELRRHLQDAGLSLEVRHDHRLRHRNPGAVLERLAAQYPAGAWVLQHQTKPVQQWFAEKAMPAVVWGSAHAGVWLASFDIHNQAACRHCIGALSRLGHRRIALVVRQTGLAGDLASEAGYEEGMRALPPPPSEPLILRHGGTVPNLCVALDHALKSSCPPTALLVSRPRDALTVITHMAQKGLRAPHDVSVVSLIEDNVLDVVVPSAARYRIDFIAYATRLSRAILQLARTGYLPPSPHLMIPTFQEGGTLAPPRER